MALGIQEATEVGLAYGRRVALCLYSRIESSLRDAVGVCVLRAYLKMDRVCARQALLP